MARLFLLAVALCLSAGAHDSRDMELVGAHGLHGRSAYQPVIQQQGERWIAYIGHHAGRAANPLTGREEDNGTSIVEVTDPRSPKLLAHIPGEPGAGAQMVRVCDGAKLPRADKRKVYLLRTRGNSAHEVWDVTDSARPSFVVTVAAHLSGTHKNWWECDTGIAYLVSGVAGWRTHRMTQVFDLSDPARPRFIRDFGLPGQQPGATGPVDTGLHGAISAGARTQPHLLRLRHQRGRRPADRRSPQAPRWAAGAHRGEPAASASGPPRPAAHAGCPHHLSDPRRGGAGVRP